MDEKRSRAVTEAFVRLYKEGLIYRYVHFTKFVFPIRLIQDLVHFLF